MKHIVAMIIMVLVAASIITAGLHQRAEEQKQLEFERKQAIQERNNRNPPLNTSTENQSNTDPFGLFGPEEAVYTMTFHTQWTASRQEDYHVSIGHFAAPTYWVGSNNPIFSIGAQASPGVEELAEVGRARTLKKELEQAQNQGLISSFAIQDRVETPRSISYEITVNRDNPVVSFISALGPSPDWFVALEGVSLLREGRWVKEAGVQLVALDAGTEDGDTFSISNPETSPQGVIAELVDIPSVSLPPFAYIEFTQVGYDEE